MSQESLLSSSEIKNNYLTYVDSFEFGEYEKLALDLAQLLDNPDLAVVGDPYNISKAVELRTKVFDAFCATCLKAGVDVPPLDKSLYMPLVTRRGDSFGEVSKVAAVKNVSEFVEGQVTESADPTLVAQLHALTGFLKLFPQKFDLKSGYGNTVSSQEVVAMLNKLLIENGLLPIRPDYSKFNFSKTGISEAGPKESVKALIVDDDFSEIVNTVLALVGWPNLTIDYLKYERSYNDKSPAAEKISGLADIILSKSPDVILMDQGIDEGVEGSEVVKSLSTRPEAKDISYVANTGGDDAKLRAQGALGNFGKGKNGGAPIRSALSRFS